MVGGVLGVVVGVSVISVTVGVVVFVEGIFVVDVLDGEGGTGLGV